MVSDKALISRIFSTTKKQPNSKWRKGSKRLLSKEDMQVATKHIKRCSSLIIREVKIKNYNDILLDSN